MKIVNGRKLEGTLKDYQNYGKYRKKESGISMTSNKR